MMKKTGLLLSLLIFTSLFSFGQAQRRVLVEEATNASCGPCASQNPAFDALLQQNADIVSVIKYHASWPGTDPMYNHNTEENSSRISYYGVTGVPTAMVGGQFNGSPSQVSATMINNYANEGSPFEEIDIYHYLSPGEDTIFVFMRIQAAQDFSENSLKAHTVVVEKHIHFNSAPGSNTETDFYDVMKKMLPGPGGLALKSNWTEGEYKVIAQAWELENVYDLDQLSVVGFVQNSITKYAHQSGVSSTETFPALYPIDATPSGITNLTSTTCASKFSPAVNIANFGSDDLTSLEIHYSVNGGEEQMYTWNGNIEYLKLGNVLLPEIEFSLMEENQLKVYFSNTNGVGDDYPDNDTLVFSFDRSIVVPESVSLIIKLDTHPEETTWEIVNADGEVAFSGGPYTTPNGFISLALEFESTDCYQFTIYDAGNNGLTLPGFFSLFKGSTQILTGSAFGTEASQMFLGDLSIGVPETGDETEMSIYPNPATNQVSLEFNIREAGDASIDIYNAIGMLVKRIDAAKVYKGQNKLDIDVADLESGIYYVRLMQGNTSTTQKMTIAR